MASIAKVDPNVAARDDTRTQMDLPSENTPPKRRSEALGHHAIHPQTLPGHRKTRPEPARLSLGQAGSTGTFANGDPVKLAARAGSKHSGGRAGTARAERSQARPEGSAKQGHHARFWARDGTSTGFAKADQRIRRSQNPPSHPRSGPARTRRNQYLTGSRGHTGPKSAVRTGQDFGNARTELEVPGQTSASL